MLRQSIIFCLMILPVLACSDDPASPANGQLQGSEIIGDWTGSLPLLSMVPDSSFPYWPDYQNNPLYNRRYDFRNLDVSVHITEGQFLILLLYRSDSLYFYYEERGNWQISGGTPQILRMDATRLSGGLETYNAAVKWDTSGCCWQAGLSLEETDPGSVGFGVQILRLFDIQSRVAIRELQLKKELRLQLQ